MRDLVVKILLIADDEASCALIKQLIMESATINAKVDCVTDYGKAMRTIHRDQHHVYLVDYSLGEQNGLQLLQEVGAEHLAKPFILFTGAKVDCCNEIEAIRAGATDYLIKEQLSPPLLTKSIRYCVQQKDMQRALKESEERFHFMMKSTGDVLYRLRYETMSYDYVSPAMKNLTGYTAKEVAKRGFASLVRRIESLDGERILEEELIRNREERRTGEFRADYLVRAKGGTLRWLRDHSFPWYDESGRLIGSTGILTDVTDLKAAESSLRASEKQLRFLASKLITVQEEERERLARELHDGCGQTLIALKIGVERAIKDARTGDSDTVIQGLQPLVSRLQDTIDEMRRIYMTLRPTVLDDFGIIAAIDWFARKFEKVHDGIRIEKKIGIREEDVPEHLRVDIYRIIQEAAENAARHGKATKVIITLRKAKNSVELLVKDNGHGFDTQLEHSVDACHRGMGLAYMKKRAKLCGGSFHVKSGKRTGTTIQSTWPQV